jgi:hypothetical protein
MNEAEIMAGFDFPAKGPFLRIDVYEVIIWGDSWRISTFDIAVLAMLRVSESGAYNGLLVLRARVVTQ